MSKVTGPLFSLDARNKLGDAIVYSYWKGINYVRSRVIPKNPQSDDQAEIRTYLGAVGKNNKMVETPTPEGKVEAVLLTQIKEVTPAEQSWSSYFAKTQIGAGASAIIAALKDFADPDEHWADAAATIPLVGFNVGYGVIEPITGAQQLFVSYTAAYALGLAIAPVPALEADEEEIQAFAAAYKATEPTP